MESADAGAFAREHASGSPAAPYTQVVPAVEQAARLLFALAEEPRTPMSLSGLCRITGVHKSKGLALLNTLRRTGLVVRHEEAKTYSLGPGLLHLSRAMLDGTDLVVAAGPMLARLAVETGSTAVLAMVSASRAFVLAREEAPGGIGVTIRVGQSYPLTWGAHGKAIVAFLPPDEQARVVADEDLYFYSASLTDGEPVDRQTLLADLALVRRQGYSTDLGRLQHGVNAVGAPVLDAAAYPVGCVILVGTFPAPQADDLGAQVAVTARRVSAVLGGALLADAPESNAGAGVPGAVSAKDLATATRRSGGEGGQRA